MQILRHSQIAVTMNVYSEAPSKATRAALKRLGKAAGRVTGLLYLLLYKDQERPLPIIGNGLYLGWS